MSEDKNDKMWAAMLNQLSPEARLAVRRDEPTPIPDPRDRQVSAENEEYAFWRSQLSAAAQEDLDTLSQPEADDGEVRPDQGQARYCLVENPDGEWSQTRLFRTADGLARRIGQIDGDDTVVWAFLGIPLRITKGPQRYLLLPDGVSALPVPRVPGMPAAAVDADLVLETFEIQEDGFLGADALVNSATARTKTRTPAARARVDDDDDEDDDAPDEDDD